MGRQDSNPLHAAGWPRPWLLWSSLGVAWSAAHTASELAMGATQGADQYKVAGVALPLVGAAVLVAAARGRGQMAYLAIIIGALGCFGLSVGHYALAQPVTRVGILPWMPRPEGAAASWALPYNLLVYAGTLVGLGILWTGARLARDARFCTLVAILLLAEGLVTMALPDGPRGADGLIWTGGIGVSGFVIMWLSRRLAAPRTSMVHAVDGFRIVK